MKIFIGQINPIIGDFKYNKEKILNCIKIAKNKSCNLAIFPELAITGYPPLDFISHKSFVEENIKILQEIIKETNKIGVIIGFIDIHKDKLFNAAALFKDGKILFKTYKSLLPNYDIFDEKRYFSPNLDEVKCCTFEDKKIGIIICEDAWGEYEKKYANNPIENIKDEKADLIINISASPFEREKGETRKQIFSKIAKDTKTHLVFVNQIGAADSLIFDGQSMLFNQSGEICARAKFAEEDFTIFDLNGQNKIEEAPDKTESIYKALCLGLKDYLYKNNFSTAIVALSGGIDSAVVTAICAAALGSDKIKTIFMPSLYSSQESFEDAQKLAENLNIEFSTIPINNIFEEFLNISDKFKKDTPEITEQNLQARIRGMIAMAFSNKENRLLLATGNKSELAVGYCTLYGDMCGALAVIGDIFKEEVYKIANFINKDKEIIPKRIIQKAPSAELKEDQKDEDELGSYEILDQILKYYIEEGYDTKEIISKGFSETLVKKIIKRVQNNEHKRFQAAPCLKVSKKAFGSGRRYPLAHNYKI